MSPDVECSVRHATRSGADAIATVALCGQGRSPVAVGGFGSSIDVKCSTIQIAATAAIEGAQCLIANGVGRPKSAGIATAGVHAIERTGGGAARNREDHGVRADAGARGVADAIRAAVRTDIAAGAAVVHVCELVDFTTVRVVAVAVDIARAASNTATTARTRCGTIGRTTNLAASSAVAGVSR